MNYAEIIQALDNASAFDLYRLHRALDNMIDDPKRIIEIKIALRLGQKIQFYDASTNRLHNAIVEQIKLTKAVVKKLDDGRRWNIPLCAINLRGSDVSITMEKPAGLSKNELQVGDVVGFVDRAGIEQHGTVIRLNQKTASIESGKHGWRVSYALLHTVIDHDSV